jgi:FtsZ-interacting cell division protein ZipA
MRTAILLLAIVAIVVAVFAACRARDDTVADSAAGDNARADESRSDSIAATGESVPDAKSAERAAPRTGAPPSRRQGSRAHPPATRRVDDPVRDTALPPEDSIRAMRPKLPQVTPEKRPRAWRGFKLPEERPVRIPLDTVGPVQQVPDSTMKGDSTKPPKPNR